MAAYSVCKHGLIPGRSARCVPACVGQTHWIIVATMTRTAANTLLVALYLTLAALVTLALAFDRMSLGGVLIFLGTHVFLYWFLKRQERKKAETVRLSR